MEVSDFGISATLWQLQPIANRQTDPSVPLEIEEQTLAYISRILHGTKTKYSTDNKVLFTIKEALKHWRYDQKLD
jgi:hypothetical protein